MRCLKCTLLLIAWVILISLLRISDALPLLIASLCKYIVLFGWWWHLNTSYYLVDDGIYSIFSFFCAEESAILKQLNSQNTVNPFAKGLMDGEEHVRLILLLAFLFWIRNTRVVCLALFEIVSQLLLLTAWNLCHCSLTFPSHEWHFQFDKAWDVDTFVYLCSLQVSSNY